MLHTIGAILVLVLAPQFVLSGNFVATPVFFSPTEDCCELIAAKTWQKALKGLGSADAQAVQPWFDYKFLMPEIQLRSGLSHYGSAVRLRRFVDTLFNGQVPLKVALIGGSISCGEAAFPPDGKNGFFNHIESWMTSVARANISFTNGCKHGVPASYMELCLGLHVPEDVDLVFVEFDVNNGVEDKLIENGIVRVMERLIRRILGLPKRPAVVLIHFPHLNTEGYHPFYYTNADLEGALSGYYDVQSVSPRTAIWQVASLYPVPDFSWNRTFQLHHPMNLGHKLAADCVVHLFQEALLDLVHLPFTAAEQAHAALPLPGPMYADNLPSQYSSCVGELDFKQHVLYNNGWEWKDEGHVDRGTHKFGFVAYTPGSKLVVRVDTRRPNLDPSARIIFMFHYLRSYTPMGMARIECVAGCQCEPHDQEAWWPRFKHSQTWMTGVLVSQTAQCDVAVTLLDSPGMNGFKRESHKFKVSGYAVTDWTKLPFGGGPLWMVG